MRKEKRNDRVEGRYGIWWWVGLESNAASLQVVVSVYGNGKVWGGIHQICNAGAWPCEGLWGPRLGQLTSYDRGSTL